MNYSLFKACLPLVLIGLASVCSAAVAKPLSVAFMHENPVGEGGWTLSHEKARKKLDAFYGEAITTSAVDGIAPSTDADRTLTKLARDKHDLVFATSFGFLSPTQRVARRFPRTTFMHASGYLTAPNIGTYQIRAYHGRYMAGVAAAMVSKTNKVGFVAPFPIPEVIRGINAFALGMQSIKPDIELDVIWINTWSDAPKAREAADLLIAKGVDVISHHTETSAAIAAAEAKGIWSVGYQTDRSSVAPKFHLVSIEHNWFPIYQHIIDQKLAGKWTSEQIWYGAEHDASQLVAWGPAVPTEVKAKVEQVRQQIASGEQTVFVGPLYDQSNTIKLADGARLSDDELLKLEWLVRGVLGHVPK